MEEISKECEINNYNDSMTNQFEDNRVLYGSVIPCFMYKGQVYIILRLVKSANGYYNLLTDNNQLILRRLGVFSETLSRYRFIFKDILVIPPLSKENTKIGICRYKLYNKGILSYQVYYSIIVRIDEINDITIMISKIKEGNNFNKLVYLSLEELENLINTPREYYNPTVEIFPESSVSDVNIGIDMYFYDMAMNLVNNKREIENLFKA